MASNAAAKAGCQEVIFVREDGGKKFVTESAHSNCYAVKDGVIHTAPLGNLILPGITRAVTLEIASKLGIKVVEEFCTPEFFATADEVFVSAASGIVPVGFIDDKPVGNGVGTVFSQLNAEYQKLVDNN
jgi:D-alanine transaminase